MNIKQLVSRCVTVGLTNNDSRSFANLVAKMITHRGPEGAIAQLKAFNSHILRYHFGVQASSHVSLKYDYPAKLMLLKKYPIEVQLRMAFSHRFITLKEVTTSQKEKFLNAVNRSEPSFWSLDSARKLIANGNRFSETLGVYYDQTNVPSLEKLTDGNLPTKDRSNQLRKWLEDTKHFAWSTMPYEERVVPTDDFTRRRLLPKVALSDHSVGRISATQEPGGKLRVFASPYRYIQALGVPLQLALHKCLQTIPEDCTFFQENGVQRAELAFQNGQTVFSVDLSNATDAFPFTLQLDLLLKSGLDRKIVSFVERVCKGVYLPQGDLREHLGDSINWKVGQPLGFKPSFALFALTHHCLVRGICLEQDRKDMPYAILGDDVLIFDEKVYARYRQVMNDLGCAVSDSKTFVSAHFAEFAGYMVFTKPTPRELTFSFGETLSDVSTELSPGFSVQSLRPGKFRSFTLKSLRNLVSLVGRDISNSPELPDYIRGVAKVIAQLPRQYGGAAVSTPDSLTAKVIDYMDDISNNGQSETADEFMKRHMVWQDILSDIQKPYVTANSPSLDLTQPDGEAEQKLYALAYALNPGYFRASNRYINGSQLPVGKCADLCRQSIATGRGLNIARAYFEQPDASKYFLFKEVEKLRAMATGRPPVLDQDDLAMLRKAYREVTTDYNPS